MAEEQDSGEKPQPRKIVHLRVATQDGVPIEDDEAERHGGGGGPPGGAGGKREDVPIFASEEAMANVMVAERLSGDWRYGSDGRWYHYDGRCWRADDTAAIKHQARLVCRETSAKVIGQGGTVGVARGVSSAKSIRAVEEIARSDLRVATPMEHFDMDPWSLNTPDGLVNLRTGELLPHDRERLCTRMAGASPDPSVKPKQWLLFIDQISDGNKPYAEYLQRLVGYSLVGVVDEECFVFIYGPGNTGKSKFIEAVRLIHGDYGFSADMQSFVAIRGDRNGYDLASFVGRRLITAAETEEGRRWDQQRLKECTGRDRLTARNPYGRPFEYFPNFLLLMAGNYRPRLGSADTAMRRRMHLLPFRHKPQHIDPYLIDKFRAELPGIMAWAVEGAVLWQRFRLSPPPIVTEETSGYFETEDSVGAWLDERCEVDLANIGEVWTSTRDLYRDFRAFMSEGKGYIVPEAVFVARLETVSGLRRGRLTVSGAKVRGFFGVKLRYPPPQQDHLDL
jgi:putative DNA primase/helicase